MKHTMRITRAPRRAQGSAIDSLMQFVVTLIEQAITFAFNKSHGAY